MSEVSSAEIAVTQQVERSKISSEKSHWFERFNETCSEWCSSILVKETRQALKSRQFIWTYIVLLVCVGVWTVIGLTFSGNSYQIGPTLLIGFFIILGFPLAVIIPFSAYRSLAREFEDGTISLISITTMKPYQIVIGKFGSAVLQMMIYLSVLAPCICCTYLLRGVSIDQIWAVLAMCVGGSIALTILGLFLAGVFRSKTLGVGVSVLFVLFIGWLYVLWCILCNEFFSYGNPMDWNEDGVQEITFLIIALVGSTALLLLVAAVSQISFAADNRSSKVRIGMLVQQMLFFAFIILMLGYTLFDRESFIVAVYFAGHYWLLMGFLMIGESSTISRRVQRTLPRTFFSRSFFSLLMPGAGRGYLFAAANVLACSICLCAIWWFGPQLVTQAEFKRAASRWGARAVPLASEQILACAVSLIYVLWFLSIVYLIVKRLEKRKREWGPGIGPMVSLLIGALLVATLSIGGMVIHFNTTNFPRDPSIWLVFNWHWTTWDIGDDNVMFGSQVVWIFFFVIQALLVTIIAMVIASKELLCKPIAVPERVAIETEKKHPKQSLPPGESIDEIFGEVKN